MPDYYQKCPECGTNSIRFSDKRAEITCGVCGLVLEDRIIDSGSEVRAYSSEEQRKKVRVGAPTTLSMHDKGLSTKIGWKGKDAYGKKISPKMKSTINRMRIWQSRTNKDKSVDRNLVNAMNILDLFSSQTNLSKELKEKSSYIYRKVANLAKGRSIEAVMIASIFIACKESQVPRILDDFLEFTTIDKNKIQRCCRLIQSQLKIKINPTSPVDYLPRYCNKLALSNKTLSKAIEIINLAEEHNLTVGKSPSAVAGGALYLASLSENERRSQRDISIVAGVTEHTIRTRYKEFSKLPGITSN